MASLKGSRLRGEIARPSDVDDVESAFGSRDFAGDPHSGLVRARLLAVLSKDSLAGVELTRWAHGPHDGRAVGEEDVSG
jgi:hypothetical protein